VGQLARLQRGPYPLPAERDGEQRAAAYLAPELLIPSGRLFASPVIDGSLSDAVWAHAPSFDIRYGDNVLRDSYPGVLKWRSGQYQPEVNGGLAAILDPSDCTVKYFFRDDSLFLGFDVRDGAVQSYPLTDRMDGFVIGLYDRTAREPFDNTLQPHRLTFDVSPTGRRARPITSPRSRTTVAHVFVCSSSRAPRSTRWARTWTRLHGRARRGPHQDRLPARSRRRHHLPERDAL
jgi:hypothetical protein